MKFGLIGCGVISKWYVSAMEALKDAQLVAACDKDAQRVTAFCEENGGLMAYTSYEALLLSDIDTVCICTPSGLHAPLAMEALAAGKHVICEKPIGITRAQLDAIEHSCKAHNRQFCAISQLYFSDDFQKARAAVEAGRLGQLILGDISMKYFRTKEYYRSGGWRGTLAMDGGGALMNQGIHGIGLLRYLMGPVKSVTALSRTLLHEIETEDTAVAILEFQNGALGRIVATTSVQPGYPRVLSVHGTTGTIALTEGKISRWKIPGEEVLPVALGDAGAAQNPEGFSPLLHRRQIRDFIDAVAEGRSPLLGVAEGRWPVDIILAIYESSKTGKRVYL